MAIYTNEMLESMKKVEAARAVNVTLDPRRMTAEEKDTLLKTHHPDYKDGEFTNLSVGPNKGEKVPLELAAILQANPRIDPEKIDLSNPDYDVDVLIIGGGGAGASAAIEANNGGANVMIVTKLRMGDANTMMAEGGIQAADKPNDSPAQHFLDAFGGGHFAAKKELVYKLVTEAPEAIQWLNDLGVEFDKDHHARRRYFPQAYARGEGLLRRGDHADPAGRGFKPRHPGRRFHRCHRAD